MASSDDELEAELLGGDDSASEVDELDAEPEQQPSRSPSPVSREQSDSPEVSKGPARAKLPPKQSSHDEESEDEHDQRRATSPGSVGSAAMSESEDEDAVAPAATTAAAGPTRKAENAAEFKLDGIFLDSRDKAEIMALPEIQREQILADREEARRREDFMSKLKQKHAARDQEGDQRKRKAGETDLDDSPRKTARSKKSANIDEYKRQREQNIESRRRGERHNRERPSPGHDDNYGDADGEPDSDAEWERAAAKPVESTIRPDPPATLRDFERVRLGRSYFARICFTPGFEDKAVRCFAKVSIAFDKARRCNIYRMHEIKRIAKGKSYTMEAPNGRPMVTDQYVVILADGKESNWPFVTCSDSAFTQDDFERYQSKIRAAGRKVPTSGQLAKKCDDINSLINHKWTDGEITQKLKRAGVMEDKIGNIKINDLKTERAQAEAAGNEKRVAEIDEELHTLTAPKPALSSLAHRNGSSPNTPRVQTPQDRLAARNAANRKLNAENVRRAQLRELRQEQEEAARVARGEGTRDPFARVKTKAKIMHDENERAGKKNLTVPKPKDDLFGESDASRTGTPANGTPILGPKNGGKKKYKNDEDVLAELDLGIELEI